MLGDRVDSWGTRIQRFLPLAVPLAAFALFMRMARR
jgi:hypothetical protein